MAKRLLLLVFGLVPYTLFSQGLAISPAPIPYFKDFTGRANCIFQDKTGFIWIGKESGLYRYDGKELKAYRYNPSNPLSISCNFVQVIAEDATGDLWVGTIGGGLNHFHRKTGTFTRYTHNPQNLNSISFNEISSIFIDSHGNLWIGTDGGGLNHFNPTTGKFTTYKAGLNTKNGLRSNKVLHINPASNGKLWLSTWGGGLHMFDPVTKNTNHFGNNTKFEDANMYCAREVKPGLLWIATDNMGLIAYDIGQDKFSIVIPRSKIMWFWDLQVTPKGEVLAGTSNGLLYFSSAQSDYQIVKSTSPNIISIYRVMVDRTQTIWTGSNLGYIGKINSFQKNFRTLQVSEPNNPLEIYSLYADTVRDRIYFTLKSLLIEYNKTTGHLKYHKLSVEFPKTIAPIPGSNNLVVSSNLTGPFVFNTNSGSLSPIKLSAKYSTNLIGLSIRSMYAGDPLGFWIGVNALAYQLYFNPKSKLWEIGQVYKEGDGFISGSHYPSSFLRHPNGELWIGTWGGGLNRLRVGALKFDNFTHNETKTESLSDNYIQCLASDRKGNVLVGTKAGLNRFNIKTSEITSVITTDGLADDMVFSVATDKHNRTWISTRSGISMVSADFLTIKNYDVGDGLPTNEFQPNSFTTDNKGYMYFGSSRGIVWFHPDSIYDNPHLANAVVLDFKIIRKNGELPVPLQLNKPIELTSEIQLTHKQASFSIQMAALSYFNPIRNRIKYKLEGYDDDWQLAGPDMVALYSKIPAGSYTFFVNASNEDGVWNPHPKRVKIVITQPFWLSRKALWLYFILLTGTVYASVNLLKKKKKESVTLQLQPKNNAIQPSMVVIEPADQKFLQKAISIVEENIADPDFGVFLLADKMCLSRPHVYRKIHSITGVSVADFIKEVRLKRAAQMLLQHPASIAEVAYQVGFNVPKYFSKCFKQQFGVSPAQYIINNGKKLPPEPIEPDKA